MLLPESLQNFLPDKLRKYTAFVVFASLCVRLFELTWLIASRYRSLTDPIALLTRQKGFYVERGFCQ